MILQWGTATIEEKRKSDENLRLSEGWLNVWNIIY